MGRGVLVCAEGCARSFGGGVGMVAGAVNEVRG
jgi:hypothetical protein